MMLQKLVWQFLPLMVLVLIAACCDHEPTGADASTADLTLTELIVSPSAVTTREFSACSFKIVNNGPSPLSSEYLHVNYHLSTDTSFSDTADTKIGDTGFTLSIASQSSYQINLSATGLDNMVRFWPVDQSPGDYYLFASIIISNPPPNDPDAANNYVRTDTTINYNPQ